MNKFTIPASFDIAEIDAPYREPQRKRVWRRPASLAPREALADPLAMARVASRLVKTGEEHGFHISLSSDFEALREARHLARGDSVSPMFDPEISLLDEDRAFWLAARTPGGKLVALQAFRLDIVHPNLAEWALGWMAGLYLKRKELVLPRRIEPPGNSASQKLSGKLVYHGELWIDRHFREKSCFDVFPRLGMLLAYMKWQPRALWALVGEGMATRGHMVRMGYGQLERGFFSWEWEPNGADRSEWVALADNTHLEFLIAEMEAER